MNDMNRREFLVIGAAAACGCVAGCTSMTPVPESGRVDAGPIEQYQANGATDRFAKSDHVILVHQNGRLYACTALCTHKRGVLEAADAQLECPRHGARYSLDGKVLKGPAQFALARYAIFVDDRRHVIVDKSKVFEQKQWEVADSYIKV